jgi:hypothetical protein
MKKNLLIGAAAVLVAGASWYVYDYTNTEHHAGVCIAGQASERWSTAKLLYTDTFDRMLANASRAAGLNPEKVHKGYMSWEPGTPYHKSCKIAKDVNIRM